MANKYISRTHHETHNDRKFRHIPPYNNPEVTSLVNNSGPRLGNLYPKYKVSPSRNTTLYLPDQKYYTTHHKLTRES